MTDEQIMKMRADGFSRKDIAKRAGLTERQVKYVIERNKPVGAVDKAKKVANGSGMAIKALRVKGEDYSMLLEPSKMDAGSLVDKLKDAFSGIPAYEPVVSEFEYSDLLTVYGLMDLHIGQLSWSRETRGPDYDLELFQRDLTTSIDRLSSRVPPSGHALVVLGGDSLHTPNGNNETPAHKHKLDVDGRFEKIVDVAVETLAHSIEILLTKHAKVSVVVVRGNHCEESHVILKMALKQRYRNTDRVDFPVVQGADKSEIFWMKHGKNLIAVHHGDRARPEKLAMIVADKCGFWDQCVASRVILTGHVHHLRTLDLVGATHYSLRAFAPPDSHGANFGGVRGLQAMTFDPKYGLISQTHDGIWREDE